MVAPNTAEALARERTRSELIDGGAWPTRTRHGVYLNVTAPQLGKAEAEMALDFLKRVGVNPKNIFPNDTVEPALTALQRDLSNTISSIFLLPSSKESQKMQDLFRSTGFLETVHQTIQ